MVLFTAVKKKNQQGTDVYAHAALLSNLGEYLREYRGMEKFEIVSESLIVGGGIHNIVESWTAATGISKECYFLLRQI